MDLETSLVSPGLILDAVNCRYDSLEDDTKPEQSFLNISIKNEPLDLNDNDFIDRSNDAKVAENGTNTPTAEIKEITKVDDSDTACVGVDSKDHILKDEIKEKANINIISTVLVNNNYASVLDDFEVTSVGQNSDLKDNVFEDPLGDSLLLEDNTFSCTLCSFTTDRQLRLNDHERNHRKTKLPILQCFYCSQRYTRNLLYLHVQNVHPGQKFQILDKKSNKANLNTSYQCGKCLFSTKYRGNLTLHMKRKHPKVVKVTGKSSDLDQTKTPVNRFKPEKVKVTHKTSLKYKPYSVSRTDKLKLKFHTNKHFLEPRVLIDSFGHTRYECKMCSYGQKNFPPMINHIKSHKYLPTVKCTNCDFKSTPRIVKFHMSKCKENLKSNSTGSTTEVKVCQNSSSSRSNKVLSKITLKCSRCTFFTSEDLKLKDHMKKHLYEPDVVANSSGRKIYQCKMCSYGCTKFVAMIGHMNSHKNNLPITKCSSCNFKSTSRAMIFHRLKCEASLKSLGTENSEDGLTGQRSVKSSKSKEVSSKTPFKCTTCSFSTSDEVKLKVHMKKHFFEPDVLTDSAGHTIYKCRMCSYVQKKFTSMVCHINYHKDILFNVKCPKCDFKSMPRTVTFHLRKCKGISSSVENTSIVEIGQDLVESNKVSLKKDLKCSSCSFSTPEELKLKTHEKKHFLEPELLIDSSGHKTYRCKMCSYACKKIIRMVGHINTHKNSSSIIKCPNCDFKSTSRTVKFHLRRCKDRFKLSSTLEVNQDLSESFEGITESSKTTPKNLSDKMLKYNLAPEIFTNSSGYKMHQCKMCSYSTTALPRMRSHMNAHKRNLPIVKCSNCDFKSTPRALDLHIKNRHKFTGSALRTNEESYLINRPSEEVSETSREKIIKKDKPPTTNVYKCKLCSFISSVSACYKSHMTSHEQRQPIKKCPRCNFKSTPSCLHKHMALQSHHKETKCRVCSLICRNAYTLKKHMKSHLLKKPIKTCPNCSFRSTHAILRTHLQTCDLPVCDRRGSKDDRSKKPKEDIINHNDSDSKVEEEINCKEDSATTKIDESSRVSGKKAQFQCSECSFNTCLRIKLNFHTKKYHSGQYDAEQSNKCLNELKVSYNCGDCAYVTKVKAHYIRHVKSQHLYPKKNSIKKCRKCDFRSTKCAVKIHSQTCQAISTPKTIKCSLCSFSLSTMNSLKCHTETQHFDQLANQDVFELNKCNMCDFLTLFKRKMNAHRKKKKHYTSGLLISNLKSSFDNKTDNNHQINVKILATENSELNQGFEDETVHQCTSCAFSSVYKGNLKRHIEMQHVETQNRTMSKVEGTTQRSEKDTQVDKESGMTMNLRHHNDINYLDQFECDSKSPTVGSMKKQSDKENNFDEESQSQMAFNLQDHDTPQKKNRPEYTNRLHVGNMKHKVDIDDNKFDGPTNISNSNRGSDIHQPEDQSESVPWQSKDELIQQKSGKDNHFDEGSETALKTNKKKSFEIVGTVQSKPVLPDSNEEVFMSSPGEYSCSLCSYKACSKTRMNHHRKIHRKYAPIKPCPNSNCNYKSTAKALAVHFLKCSDPSTSTSELSSKSADRDVLEIFKCNICSYTSPRKYALQNHLTRSHVIEKRPVIQCIHCDFKGTPFVLEKHRAGCPKRSNLKESCSECSYSTYLPKRLREHEVKVHSKKEISENTGPKSFQCEYCSFTSFWQYLIERHMNSHTLLKLPIEKCCKCDFRSTPAALTAHVNACTKTSNALPDVLGNGPPKKKLKLSNDDVADSMNTYSDKVKNGENIEKIEDKLCNKIAEAYRIISRDDEFQSVSARKQEAAPAANHRLGVYVNSSGTSVCSVHVSENGMSSNDDLVTVADNPPKKSFECPQCSFSTKLRIRLKVHIEKKHK